MTTLRDYYVRQPKVGDLVRRYALDPERDVTQPFRVVKVHRYGRKLDVITWGSTEPITIERSNWGAWSRYVGICTRPTHTALPEDTHYFVGEGLMTAFPSGGVFWAEHYDLEGDDFIGYAHDYAGVMQGTSFERWELVDADGNVPPVPAGPAAMKVPS
jgi:hypothetical protein